MSHYNLLYIYKYNLFILIFIFSFSFTLNILNIQAVYTKKKNLNF